MSKINHPIESYMESPAVLYMPKSGLYFQVFKQLPNTDELAAYARFKCNEARDKYKAIKGTTVRARTQRDHHLAMSERWAGLASFTVGRVESMAEAQANGKEMKVYF